MKTDQFKSYQIADIGDYLKVFACSAVISQPIMSLVMDVEQPVHTQDVFGVFYNLVKYTAPAFIFGILYTTIRTNNEKNSFLMQNICGQIGLIFLYLLFGGRSFIY